MDSFLSSLVGQAGEVRPDLFASQMKAHVWILPTLFPASVYLEFWQLLSSDEQRKSVRFKQPADSHRYVATRGILRKILGVYLKCEPDAIVFEAGTFGKPILGDFQRQVNCAFNLSHSGEWALIGISRHLIGVDIEQARPVPDLAGMLDIVCNPLERIRIERYPPKDRIAQFYRLWTIKEAVSKLQGVGLSRSLARLKVELDGPDPLVGNDKDLRLPYTIRMLDAVPGYTGAVAVQASNAEIRFMQPAAPDNRPL